MRTELERVVHAGWPLVVGVLLGLAAGGIWTVAQPERHRAEARVLVQGQEVGRVVPALEPLAESSLLEQNVAQTLRLPDPPEVSAKVGEGGVVTLSVEAGSRERARQIDAEAAQVLTQLVDARFGSDPGMQATVLDPAHPVEQTSPTPGRNLLIGGLVGLAAGLAIAVALGRRRSLPRIPGAVDPGLERRLKARIDSIAKRERALARRAGELAEREQRLKRQEAEVAAAVGEVSVARPEPGPEPGPTPELEPEQRPSAPSVSVPGTWNLHELESLVRDHGGADVAKNEEWSSYLFFLREHADSDGTLAPSFDGLVIDVFGDLLERK